MASKTLPESQLLGVFNQGEKPEIVYSPRPQEPPNYTGIQLISHRGLFESISCMLEGLVEAVPRYSDPPKAAIEPAGDGAYLSSQAAPTATTTSWSNLAQKPKITALYFPDIPDSMEAFLATSISHRQETLGLTISSWNSEGEDGKTACCPYNIFGALAFIKTEKSKAKKSRGMEDAIHMTLYRVHTTL